MCEDCKKLNFALYKLLEIIDRQNEKIDEQEMWLEKFRNLAYDKE